MKDLKKSLGQHFLKDSRVVQRILSSLEKEPNRLVEIGPGSGSLTFPLLAQGREVLSVEKDQYWVDFLRERGVKVWAGPAQEPSWILSLPPGEWGVVGNLPYNSATAILRLLVFYYERFPWMVLMFQKEVGEKLLSLSSSKKGPMTVLVNEVYEGRKVLFVPPSAFYPPPKVDSLVLAFYRKPSPPSPHLLPIFWKFLTSIFPERRKQFKNRFQKVFPEKGNLLKEFLEEKGYSQSCRVEEIASHHFWELFERVTLIKKEQEE
jgi:16S rRNA (adenine1518-N6/adenine1519-N6)-dimethyltransferase